MKCRDMNKTCKRRNTSYSFSFSVTKKNSAQIYPSLPTHWPLACKPGTRIPITDQTLLSKWEAWFTASIGSQCSITSIEEVCNVDLFQIYQR